MTQDKIRNRLFLTIMIPLVVFLFYFEYNDLADSALFIYSLTFIFITLCVGLWFYWLVKNKKRASSMYILIGALFLCVGYDVVWLIYARISLVFGYKFYQDIIICDMWAYRIFPLTVLFIWLFCWILGRSLGERGAPLDHAAIDIDEKHLFFRAQKIFANEQEIFQEAQTIFTTAQVALAQAQAIFSKAQVVFSRAQKMFEKLN
jgi:hypothetical protein